jgi:predicted PurR-regulated permease PerM
MSRHVTTCILFVILLVVVLGSAFRVITPFLGGFTWAALLVAAFRPWHRRLERAFGARWAATTVVTGLVAMVVVVPLVVAAVNAAEGGLAAMRWIDANYKSGGSAAFLGLADRWPTLAATAERAKTLVGLADVDLRAKAISWLATAASFVVEQAPALVGGALGLAFSFGVMLLAMPALFANGERLSAAVADALPIPTGDATRILDDLAAMARSLVMSTGVTSAAQAALGGLALVGLGVPYAGSLTAVMFFCTLVPGGTALVWGPAAIWLAAEGHPWKAVLLVAWGGGVVSTIDNLLRPLLAGKDVKLSGGVLFVGMLGGMAAFGLVGLFLGPISLYLSRELVRIGRRDVYDAPPIEPALAPLGVIRDAPAPHA